MKVLNISNHTLTKQQIQMINEFYNIDANIVELPNDIKDSIGNLPPLCQERQKIVDKIIDFIINNNIRFAHIDGEAHFVYKLIVEIKLRQLDVRLFKFYSERSVIEKKLSDGSIQTVRTFKPVYILEY